MCFLCLSLFIIFCFNINSNVQTLIANLHTDIYIFNLEKKTTKYNRVSIRELITKTTAKQARRWHIGCDNLAKTINL
jgi:hypothetical protein